MVRDMVRAWPLDHLRPSGEVAEPWIHSLHLPSKARVRVRVRVKVRVRIGVLGLGLD